MQNHVIYFVPYELYFSYPKRKRRSGKSLIFFGFSSFIPSFVLYSIRGVLSSRRYFASKYFAFNVSSYIYYYTTFYYYEVIRQQPCYMVQKNKTETEWQITHSQQSCNLIVVLWTSVGSRWRESLDRAAPRILSF